MPRRRIQGGAEQIMGENSDQGQRDRMDSRGTVDDGDITPGTLLMALAFGGVFDETNRFVSKVAVGDLVLYVGPYPPDKEWGFVCTPDGRYGRMYLGRKGIKQVAR